MTSGDRIASFIAEHTGEADDLPRDLDIFEAGLVRSMFVMQLVVFVEQEFGITLTGPDLDFDSFRSVNSLEALVSRKLTALSA